MVCLVDSHCHLASLRTAQGEMADLSEVVARAHHAGVSHMLCVACTLREFAPMAELTRGFAEVLLAVGMHPLNLDEEPPYREEELAEAFARDDRLIALGETGLDYHYRRDSARAQQDSFVRHIELARILGKPLIVHARDAGPDIVALLRSHHAHEARGIMHCFCDTIETARSCLDLGFMISFSGIATFRGAGSVREVLAYVPDDRLLVETDAPYLAPVPVRGHANEPAFVRYTLECIARLRGMPAGQLADLTSRNFSELFALKLEDYPPTPSPAPFSTADLDDLAPLQAS